MSDGYVVVPPDSTGKKIDTSELTKPDTTVVERQRVVLADDTDPNRRAGVTAEGLQIDGMAELLFLMKRQNALLLSIAMQLGSMASAGFIDPDQLMEG